MIGSFVFVIFVLMSAVGQVCNRIVQYWCTFDWKLNGYACVMVLHALLFGVCSFTCVITFFFEFAITKLALHFFDCFTFALWTVFWYNYLRVDLHDSWLFGFTSTIPWLPYFFKLFFTLLLDFCCQNTHFHTFCFLQVFLNETCEFFRAFWLNNLPIVVLVVIFACYVVLWFSFCIVTSFVIAFFAYFLRLLFLFIFFGLHKFAVAGFRCFWHRCLFVLPPPSL